MREGRYLVAGEWGSEFDSYQLTVNSYQLFVLSCQH